MLAAGATLRAVMAATGISVYSLFLLGAHGRRRGPNLSPREKQNIERLLRTGRLSQRAIGRRVRRAASTVNRIARIAELRRTGGRRFRRLRRPAKCPRHGLVKFWPCVICAAKQL